MRRWLYNALWWLAVPLICLRLLLRSRKQPEYRQRMAERFGFYPALSPQRLPLVWLHAVSVGELLAAIPLIEHLLARGDCQLLVTTTTPTGSAQVQAKLGGKVLHVYAPYDISGVIERTLTRFRPQVLLVMETELWPNWLRQCQRRGIATILVNGRMSERSARGYRRLGGLTRSMLSDLSCALVQYQSDGDRLVALGLPPERLQICGSVKFDVTLTQSQRDQAKDLRETWPSAFVWVAASTHPGEEQSIIEAHKTLQRDIPDALLVLVPRHPERAQEVIQLCQGMSLITRSSGVQVTDQSDVLLLDTLGELMVFYGAADAAFVGGSLVPHGGHNLVEPAVWGKPVVSGPSVFNFANMAEEMTRAQGLTIVDSPATLAQVLVQWATYPEQARRQGRCAADYAAANRGALQRVLMALAGYLPGS